MSAHSTWPVDRIRRQFPALKRTVNGKPAVFLDGAAGSQVPQNVADAVSRYLLHTNANRSGPFATSLESDAVLDSAHRTLADLVGTPDPDEICFGANTTTITLQFSRALSKEWDHDDEIIVCRGDHDANFTPWILAARDAGTTVRFIELHDDDATLDLNSLRNQLSSKTRLVAVGLAGNATGTINPVADISHLAHQVNALLYVDAVHFAPHGRINVDKLGCDFLVCSAYKFFGPHVGVFWGRRSLLEQYEPCKLRPASNTLPSRWMTGTQCHEGIAGAAAAVEYLASLGQSEDDSAVSDRSARLDTAFERIATYEQTLSARLLSGLQDIRGLKIHGIADLQRINERVPTVSVTFENMSPKTIAGRLADEGIFVWAGNHYAQPFTEAAGLEPDGTLRISALHYNTADEIDRVLDAVRRHTSR
ncbi:MAG: cysteine desulfurase-like protein [Planctomycetaceae bacterium]|jgi:cysteine desulfurase family protein (TIGR01976 family)